MEVCYRGTGYAGFQVQENANTIQGEVERAMYIVLKRSIVLSGSSRTDSGVHARQNYFHFDYDGIFDLRWIYNLNAVLPPAIAIRSVRPVPLTAHCRFDAVYRRYSYLVYRYKDPFLQEVGYYFPYPVNLVLMNAAAEKVLKHSDFLAFSKRNTQVKTFQCRVTESRWVAEGMSYRYEVRANRFLRGMVRGLVGTMLQVGRGKISVETFGDILLSGDAARVDFAVPGQGLCLREVGFPDGYFG